jgi:hypothetical protein
MQAGVSSLVELRRFLAPDLLPPWHQHIVQRELNGGRTSTDDLEGIRPEVTALTVSGLDQASFEALARRWGGQLTALHLWKCPRLEDLSPMEAFPGLTHVAVYWNQRATRLWDMRRTPRLQALHLTDFLKLNRLDDLARAAESLTELEFGNANFSRCVVESLEPLASLGRLARLRFNAKQIVDGRVQPLAKLTQLTELEFPAAQFSVEQIAWLRARLPGSVEGAGLGAYQTLSQPIRRGPKVLDILVNGKRMPFLSSTADAKRVAKVREAFEALVAHFAANPEAQP